MGGGQGVGLVVLLLLLVLVLLVLLVVSKARILSAAGEECKGAQEPPPSDTVVRDGSAGPRTSLSS